MESKIVDRELNGLLTIKVKVTIHLWVLLIKLNNFTFGIKAELCLESTILDGLPAWRSCKYNHLSPQLGLKLGLGLSLATNRHTNWPVLTVATISKWRTCKLCRWCNIFQHSQECRGALGHFKWKIWICVRVFNSQYAKN